jgi:hypothetical protein
VWSVVVKIQVGSYLWPERASGSWCRRRLDTYVSIDRLTAPEAVVRSRLYLHRLPGKTLAGPRLVRRLLSVRSSGGRAGPGKSITVQLTGPYSSLALHGVQGCRQASTAVVSKSASKVGA